MRKRRLLNIIGEINDDYIMEAAPDKEKKKKTIWMKWVAAAACLVLVLAAGIPLVNNFTKRHDDGTVEPITLVEYSNACYEVIKNNPKLLERKGIEADITEDLAGNHLTYLKKKSDAPHSDFIVSSEETNIELLEYAPANHGAVKILRNGDKYYAAVFCNYLVENAEGLPFEEVFKVYGIEKAADIKSIVSVKTDNEYEANGNAVANGDLITSFYNEITSLEKYGEDEFDKAQFTYEDESRADEYHGQFADDRKDFMIETVDGLRFVISYYPTYGWVNASMLQTYYKLSPALEAWIETNL